MRSYSTSEMPWESGKYPSWAINKVQNKIINDNQEDNTVNNNHGGITMQGTSSTSYHNQLAGPPGEDPP